MHSERADMIISFWKRRNAGVEEGVRWRRVGREGEDQGPGIGERGYESCQVDKTKFLWKIS